MKDSIRAMLWREVMRILRCGPSKRPATNSNYNRSTSHPSMTNLNESASANSLNKSNYMTTKLGGSAGGSNNNGSLNQNSGLYGNTLGGPVYDRNPNAQFYQDNINSIGQL